MKSRVTYTLQWNHGPLLALARDSGRLHWDTVPQEGFVIRENSWGRSENLLQNHPILCRHVTEKPLG